MLKRFIVILGVLAMMGITMGCEPPETEEYQDQGGQQQQQQQQGQDQGGGGFD